MQILFKKKKKMYTFTIPSKQFRKIIVVIRLVTRTFSRNTLYKSVGKISLRYYYITRTTTTITVGKSLLKNVRIFSTRFHRFSTGGGGGVGGYNIITRYCCRGVKVARIPSPPLPSPSHRPPPPPHALMYNTSRAPSSPVYSAIHLSRTRTDCLEDCPGSGRKPRSGGGVGRGGGFHPRAWNFIRFTIIIIPSRFERVLTVRRFCNVRTF